MLDARPLRGPRAGADQDGVDVVELVEVDLVVAPDRGVRAELGEVLDEVVDEAVVVVDDEDAHPIHPIFGAARAARQFPPLPSDGAGAAAARELPDDERDLIVRRRALARRRRLVEHPAVLARAIRVLELHLDVGEALSGQCRLRLVDPATPDVRHVGLAGVAVEHPQGDRALLRRLAARGRIRARDLTVVAPVDARALHREAGVLELLARVVGVLPDDVRHRDRGLLLADDDGDGCTRGHVLPGGGRRGEDLADLGRVGGVLLGLRAEEETALGEQRAGLRDRLAVQRRDGGLIRAVADLQRHGGAFGDLRVRRRVRADDPALVLDARGHRLDRGQQVRRLQGGAGGLRLLAGDVRHLDLLHRRRSAEDQETGQREEPDHDGRGDADGDPAPPTAVRLVVVVAVRLAGGGGGAGA